MGLASIIRLEFAYPGVGILGGDSLQYLSIATAHGVIMVFFMIMPSVFGAFGNFLLPTQLGVHDVAFPRLNSAAFWFLPGGLIMLMQLVCVDRRYQRMNCFNIRELQGVLKRKFFTDLTNSADHTDLISGSAIGLRYKLNNTLATNPDMISFFNYGTTTAPKTKTNMFASTYTPNVNNLLIDSSYLAAPFTSVHMVSAGYVSQLRTIASYFSAGTSISLFLSPLLITQTVQTLGSNLKTFTLLASTTSTGKNLNLTHENTLFYSEGMAGVDVSSTGSSFLGEGTSGVRFTRASNPLISYDYKCGHYLGI